MVLPLHVGIEEEFKKQMKFVAEYNVSLGWRNQQVKVFQIDHFGVKFYFLDNPYYFNRPRIYGEFDDGERYGFYSKAVTILPKIIGFKPNIVHTNDWHTGLVNLYMKDFSRGDIYYEDIKTVFTIHNLKYQGVFDEWILYDILGLSGEYFNEEGIKFYDKINYMKAGINYSHSLTTVSESYAEEIKYGFFGENLEQTLNSVSHKLKGIINGIDYEFYNPLNDKYIDYNYDIKNIEDKYRNKEELLDRLH